MRFSLSDTNDPAGALFPAIAGPFAKAWPRKFF
jgi:hypothetical protein